MLLPHHCFNPHPRQPTSFFLPPSLAPLLPTPTHSKRNPLNATHLSKGCPDSSPIKIRPREEKKIILKKVGDPVLHSVHPLPKHYLQRGTCHEPHPPPSGNIFCGALPGIVFDLACSLSSLANLVLDPSPSFLRKFSTWTCHPPARSIIPRAIFASRYLQHHVDCHELRVHKE